MSRDNYNTYMPSIRNKAILATVVAAIFWSSGGLFIKLLPLDPFTILFYRSFYSAIFFLILFPRSLFRFNKTMVVSICFYAPLLICFVTATKLTTAANAIFLQYTAPAIVLLIEPFLLKTRFTRINLFTVLICMTGMSLFFYDQFAAPGSWLGVSLAAFSGLMLAGLILSQKMNSARYHTGAVFWGNILVCLITIPWFFSDPFPEALHTGYLIFLGFGQLGMGYLLFLYGQRSLSAIESSLIAMLEPILNPVWVLIGYGEEASWFALTGGSLIIAAIIFRMYWTEVRQKNSLA